MSTDNVMSICDSHREISERIDNLSTAISNLPADDLAPRYRLPMRTVVDLRRICQLLDEAQQLLDAAVGGAREAAASREPQRRASAMNVPPIRPEGALDEEYVEWIEADEDERQAALSVCKLASEQLRAAYVTLEARFSDKGLPDLPEPPGWCPVAALDLIDQAIGMLEPCEDDD